MDETVAEMYEYTDNEEALWPHYLFTDEEYYDLNYIDTENENDSIFDIEQQIIKNGFIVNINEDLDYNYDDRNRNYIIESFIFLIVSITICFICNAYPHFHGHNVYWIFGFNEIYCILFWKRKDDELFCCFQVWMNRNVQMDKLCVFNFLQTNDSLNNDKCNNSKNYKDGTHLNWPMNIFFI